MEVMDMKIKSGILYITLILCITLINANKLNALTISNAEIDYINCEGICFQPGITFTYDRDNTGSSAESNGIVITDGGGNLLYSDGGVSPVPGTNTIIASWCFTYNTAPQYNPIRVQLISSEGNGFSRQIAYQTTGTCQGLPYLSVPSMNKWGMIILITLAGLGSIFYLRKRKQTDS